MHTRLQQLHIEIFHGPFGKPKDVPHLLTRISDLRGDFLNAHEYTWYPKREAIIELMGLLVSLLVKRAKQHPQLRFTYWDGSGREFRRLWSSDRERFLLWWPAIREANQPLQLPKQDLCRPLPPIPFHDAPDLPSFQAAGRSLPI